MHSNYHPCALSSICYTYTYAYPPATTFSLRLPVLLVIRRARVLLLCAHITASNDDQGKIGRAAGSSMFSVYTDCRIFSMFSECFFFVVHRSNACNSLNSLPPALIYAKFFRSLNMECPNYLHRSLGTSITATPILGRGAKNSSGGRRELTNL